MSLKFRLFIGLVILSVVAVVVGLPHLKPWLAAAVEWTAALGAWGPVLFVALYTVAVVFFVPASVLSVGAGAVFGLFKGAVLVLLGATVGATVAFLLGRYFARDWVKSRVAHHPRFAAVDAAVAREGWKIVLLARLCPVFPFIFLNYALGLTSIALRPYVIGTAIGIVPAMVMLVYIGSAANAAASQERTPAQWALYGVGLAATILISVHLTRFARRALDEKAPAAPPPRPADGNAWRLPREENG
jgi:uncharacterized membrane protein YdjX (TVP38/TMEM64 family)